MTLDTPGGAVNVFTREAAAQLSTILGEISPSVRALVLRSGKPRSFINGVGLLMAGTLKNADDALRMTNPIRHAYRALRNCRIPTVAAIEGNCYGCGIELTLQCRHRVAADTFDTQFYMTEIPEYLFLPTFGGTQDLPRLIGLEAASDLVLSGTRWSARKALELGLVDRCLAPASFAIELERFIHDGVLRGGTFSEPKPRLETEASKNLVVHEMRRRVGKLPPAYRDVYLKCLELMAAASVKDRITDDDYAREAMEAAHAAMAPPSRAAWPFFFIRQMAASLATERTPRTGPRLFGFVTSHPPARDFVDELAARCDRPTLDTNDNKIEKQTLSFVSYSPAEDTGDTLPQQISLSTHPSLDGFDKKRRLVLHVPFRSAAIRVAEIASAGWNESELRRTLSVALVDADYTVIHSRPDGVFVLDGLLISWLTPQLAYLRLGGAARDLAATLRTFGFTRFAGDWIQRLDRDSLCGLLRPRTAAGAAANPHDAIHALPTVDSADGTADPAVLGGLLASLAAFAVRTLRAGRVSHVAFLDSAARDVIDFPLLHTSLCRYCTVSRVRRLLHEQNTFRELIVEDDVASLTQFVAEGQEHYRG